MAIGLTRYSRQDPPVSSRRHSCLREFTRILAFATVMFPGISSIHRMAADTKSSKQ